MASSLGYVSSLWKMEAGMLNVCVCANSAYVLIHMIKSFRTA